MSSYFRREIVIILFDFLISLFAFWLARYFGELPRWYWLVLSAVIWVLLGGVSRKLQFGSYKRVRYALLGILVLDVFSGLFLYFLYRHWVPGYEYDHSIILATGIIVLLEWGLYYSIRNLVYRKIPYFYEEPLLSGVSENGLNPKSRLEENVKNPDIDRLLNITLETESCKKVIIRLKDNSGAFSTGTILLDSSNPESVLAHKVRLPRLVVHLCPLNEIRHLNTFFSYTNYCLVDGGCIACHCTTSGIRKEKIMRQNPVVINRILCFLDYCWHRVIPKLSLTKDFYYWVTKGKVRALTRVEVLGRLYRAGFDVLHEEVTHGEFYVIAAKVKEPVRDDKPSTGLLIRLKRVGKNGKTIGVYKFRTMFAYSEYIQAYVFNNSTLIKGDKIKDDYRITSWGKAMRKCWIDELPQLINLLKGDMKLIGVRPLSPHKFSLYHKELQELRIKSAPGLIPPYYADLPQDLKEMEASEVKYLQSYFEHPFLTDWRYFWKAFGNIALKGKRSK